MHVENSLRGAYLTLKENPMVILLFIGYAIINFLLTALIEIVYSTFSTSSNISIFLISFIVFVIAIVTEVVFYFILASISVMIAKQKFSGEKILLKKAFNDAKPFFIRTVGLSIVIFLIFGISAIPLVFSILIESSFIAISIVLFIIGIIIFVLFAVGLSQSLTISMIENLGIIASIKKSYNKSLQYFWSIFEIELTIFVFSFAIGLVGLLLSFLSPLLYLLINIISASIFYPILIIAIPLFYLYSNQKPDSNKPKIGTGSASPKISQG